MRALTASQQDLLVDVLATVDALWTPFRVTIDKQVAAAGVDARRWSFWKHGLAFTIGGVDATRQAGNRELRGLESRGLVRFVGRGKARGLALTPFGDDYAHALTCSFLAADQFDLIAKIDEAVDRIGSNQGFVNECDFLKTDYATVASPELVGLEINCLPLLCRGWVESASDSCRRIGYRVTGDGRLAQRPEQPAGLPRWTEESSDAYWAAYTAALASREGWRPEKPNHLSIPLGAGDWP